jgi:hypothetical protein
MMRYIRRKNNILIIKAFGMVGAGGLGTFDANLYEEIEGALPANFQLEPPALSGEDLLLQLRAQFRGLSVEQQYGFRQTMSEVVAAAQGDNILLMRYIIQQVALPASMESLRVSLLAVFPSP